MNLCVALALHIFSEHYEFFYKNYALKSPSTVDLKNNTF